MKILIKTLVVSLVFSAAAYASMETLRNIPQNREFFSLLWDLSEGEKISYEDIRFAYAKTTMYDPYGVDENKEKMQEYHRLGELSKAVQYANEVLKKNFVDIDAHLNLTMIYDKLGETKKKEYHQYVFSSLIHLIKNSGDGESRETAYKVISVREEYNFLDAMGLKA